MQQKFETNGVFHQKEKENGVNKCYPPFPDFLYTSHKIRLLYDAISETRYFRRYGDYTTEIRFPVRAAISPPISFHRVMEPLCLLGLPRDP
jgi:hypothetical protein